MSWYRPKYVGDEERAASRRKFEQRQWVRRQIRAREKKAKALTTDGTDNTDGKGTK